MYKLQYLQRTREKKKEERKIAIEAVTKTMGLSEENQRDYPASVIGGVVVMDTLGSSSFSAVMCFDSICGSPYAVGRRPPLRR